MRTAGRIALASLLALSCGGDPAPSLVDVPTPKPAEGATPSGLEIWLHADVRPRFFPALGVLHEPAGARAGRDFRVDASGRATRMEGDPFASQRETVLVDVIGDWPRTAWARALVPSNAGTQRYPPDRQLLVWNGDSWEERTRIGDLLPFAPPPDEEPPPSPVTRAALMDLVPWGREGRGAIAVAFDFSGEWGI